MDEPLYNYSKNPLYKFFDSIFGRKEKELKDELIYNSYATSEEEYKTASRLTMAPNSYNASIEGSYISYEQFFKNKKQKIDKLREMCDYPDIAQAVDWVCNDAVVHNSQGSVIKFNINDDGEIQAEDRKKLNSAANYILNDVLQVDRNLWGYCKRYLTEGEIYLEKILNDKKDSIIGVKVLPAFLVTPHYEANVIKEFLQLNINKMGDLTLSEKTFPENQITYVHWDEYVDGDMLNPKSYLWYAVRAYNMLKGVEDSLLNYRLTRSVERRIFNIEVGNMPPGKAKEFMRKLIQEHRKTQTYDSSTGQMSQVKNLMSFNEDFWFERRAGAGSEVKNLESGMNLGELRDVDYFQKKLYKALKIPKSRWDEVKQAVYNPGRTAEIERDELDFSAFVIRVQNRIKKMFMDLFITEIKLRGFDEKYINPKLYDFEYSKIDYLAAYKEMDLLENRAQILNLFSPYILSEQNPGGILSKEFVMKHYFKMSDDEYQNNTNLLHKELTENQEKQFFDSLQSQGAGGTDEIDPQTGEVADSLPLGDDLTIFDLYGDDEKSDEFNK